MPEPRGNGAVLIDECAKPAYQPLEAFTVTRGADNEDGPPVPALRPVVQYAPGVSMKAVIVHSDGRNTDLSQGVDPATYAELESNRYSRSSPTLWCGSCGGSLYIRHGSKRKDELFGAHHDAGRCEARLVISPAGLSDEHKCQAEYHALAAEHAGHRAELEVNTTGRTRVDVVIDGSVGIEVQWSALTKAAAKDRTARSIAAGLRSVTWFTARTENPLWNGHVPGYRTTARPELWKHLPKPRSAYSAGLRIIEAVRCGERNICQHPRGTCPRFIPWDEPWGGLLVDDVVEGLAADLILPVLLHRNVQLLSTESLSLYEELTGQPLVRYSPGQPETALAPSARQECDRVFQVPDNAPPGVRAWLEAEQQRAAEQRERRDRAMLDQKGHSQANQPSTNIHPREQMVQDIFTRTSTAREHAIPPARAPRQQVRSHARLERGSCPLCSRDHESCQFGHGLYCIQPDCKNPHHRAAP